MELRHLRYFVAVAQELHFRKAAEKLHIVQPALSKQIKALEIELGIRLLDRDRRHVKLTEEGRIFFDEALSILSLADGAKQRVQAMATGQVGYLSIGFIQPALAALVPESLRKFRAKYPGVRIRLTEMNTVVALQKLLAGEVQCAFMRLPLDLAPGLLHRPLSREDVVLSVPEDHPLAKQERVSLEELKDEDFILIDRRAEPKLHDYYISLCNEAGFSPRIVQEVNSTWVATGLVASGMGVGFVPESAALTSPRGVSFLPIEGIPAQLSMGLVWAAENNSPVLDNFLEIGN